MKTKPTHALFALWLALAFALGPTLRAQDTPPATPAPSAEKKVEETKPDPAAEKTKSDDSNLAKNDEKTPATSDDKVTEAVDKTSDKTVEQTDEPEPKGEKKHHNKVSIDGSHSSGGDKVHIMENNHVAEGVTVKGDAVAVMGDLTVDGEVMRDAVAVMGDNVINGTVHGNAVAVMGDMTLGPKARVDRDIVCVGGEIHRDPGAVVGGESHSKSIGIDFNLGNAWWGKTLRKGRPLAIGAHLGWLWIATAISIAFYALLALAFPGTIRKCGDKLIRQPGMTVLAAVLGLFALPVLFLLLCITIIGIPVALLLLPLGVLLAVLFGKASIYALVGRLISQDRLHPALAVIVGALIFVILYLVPVAGLLLSLLVSLLGYGCVVLTMFTPAPKTVTTPTPPVMGEAAPVVAAVVEGASPVQPSLPPVISAATLVRAGFWIRVAAALLDVILVGIILGVSETFFHRFGFHPGEAFPLWLAAFCTVMWATKGTTIGGIICGLKLVRLDDRPVDWGVAIVRGLSAFLSLAVAGLGFIWVAFDDEKQSWHDKIAGTTIVRVPKGTPLL